LLNYLGSNQQFLYFLRLITRKILIIISIHHKNKNNNSKSSKHLSVNLLNKALREMKMLKTGELHYYDAVLTYLNVSGTNISFNNVQMPSIGTGLTSSASGRITMRSLDTNITLQNVSTAQPCAVRILVGQSIGLDNSIATANCLENVTTGAIAVTSPYSFKDANVSVKHLADYHFDTDPQWGAQRTKFGRHNLPMKETKYSASEAEWGFIPWFIIANTNITTNGLSVTVYTRLWFYDGA
jgi:hypothetical protein